MSSIPMILMMFVWLLFLQWSLPLLLTRHGVLRGNYLGNVIPVGMGVIVALWSVPILAFEAWNIQSRSIEFMAIAFLIGSFTFLGFMDDVKGDRTSTGIAGHLRVFVTKGIITTGFGKAVGGLIIASSVSYFGFHDNRWSLILHTLIIALGANAINLLDLRPGRAGAVSLLISTSIIGMCVVNGFDVPLSVVILIIPLIVLYERDSRGFVMMGDAGSNPIGATLAMAFLRASPGQSSQISALAALIGFHLLAEKWSISQIIDKTPILARIDRLTGLRLKR